MSGAHAAPIRRMPQQSRPPQPRQLRLSAPPERIAVGHHSGPGLRLIVWVQGCSLLCTKQCLNPHLLTRAGGHVTTAPILAAALLKLAQDFSEAEGVTVLGGEPFDQAEALAQALAPVRAAGLSVMTYTGHTLEWLRAGAVEGAGRLLELCDILVDGPFVDELYDPALIWRGSSNQRVLRLSDHYTAAQIDAALSRQERSVAVSVGPRGDVSVSGAQALSTAQSLRRLTRE